MSMDTGNRFHPSFTLPFSRMHCTCLHIIITPFIPFAFLVSAVAAAVVYPLSSFIIALVINSVHSLFIVPSSCPFLPFPHHSCSFIHLLSPFHFIPSLLLLVVHQLLLLLWMDGCSFVYSFTLSLLTCTLSVMTLVYCIHSLFLVHSSPSS